MPANSPFAREYDRISAVNTASVLTPPLAAERTGGDRRVGAERSPCSAAASARPLVHHEQHEVDLLRRRPEIPSCPWPAA